MTRAPRARSRAHHLSLCRNTLLPHQVSVSGLPAGHTSSAPTLGQTSWGGSGSGPLRGTTNPLRPSFRLHDEARGHACHEDETGAGKMRHWEDRPPGQGQESRYAKSRCPQLTAQAADTRGILQPKCPRSPEALSPGGLLFLPGNEDWPDSSSWEEKGMWGSRGQARSPLRPTGVQQVVGGLLALPCFPRPHCCGGRSARPRRSASPARTISPHQARGIQSRPTRPAVQRQGSTETRRARPRDQALHITLTTLRKTSLAWAPSRSVLGHHRFVQSTGVYRAPTVCQTPLSVLDRAANKPSDQGVIRGKHQVCSARGTQRKPLTSQHKHPPPPSSSQVSSSSAWTLPQSPDQLRSSGHVPHLPLQGGGVPGWQIGPGARVVHTPPTQRGQKAPGPNPASTTHSHGLTLHLSLNLS